MTERLNGFVCVLLIGMCTVGPVISQDTEDLEALYWARKDSALTRFSQADVDFMTGMIGHHAQALIMSAFAESNSASPEIQTLAARIINAQNDEIRIMQDWLRKRDQPVPHVMIEGSSLMIHGVDDHHALHMPGMLSQEQLDELEAAKGVDFDQLFLEYMMMHHEGAVLMVRELLKVDGAVTGDDTYKLATDIHVDQVTEINRMTLMLDRLKLSQ
jgi:uncharacterized protein (DUF305 family)